MTMTQTWQKRFHPLYLQVKSEFDPHVIEWITKKEDYICASPQSNPLLKHDFPGIRRYKTGKLRILYALSTEAAQYWEKKPETPELMLLYVDLRSDDTYKDALKALRKHSIL